MYRALVALGNMLYAAKQFNTPLSAEEAARAKSALENVGKISFIPKPGQSAAGLGAEERKVVDVVKEVKEVLATL